MEIEESLDDKKRNSLAENKSIKIEENTKIKAKSDEQKNTIKDLTEFDIKKSFFVAKKISDFNKIIKGFTGKIKSIIMNSGEITSKLPSSELSLKNCSKIALEKVNTIKTKSDVDLILTYDNTNQLVLLKCLEKLREFGIINKTKEYKYCFCKNTDIKIGNITNKIDLNFLFDYNFIFNNALDAQIQLKKILKSLVELVDQYYNLKYLTTNKEVILNYAIDENGTIQLNEKKTGEKIDLYNLYLAGYKFIEFYPKIKDFDKFINYYPFNYSNNKILYMSFLINKIYSAFIENKNNNIKIISKFFLLIYHSNKLIYSICRDLNEELKSKKDFFIKIRFLTLLFDLNIPEKKFTTIMNDFENHIFDDKSKFTKAEALKFKTEKEPIDKIDFRKNISYIVLEDSLLIKKDDSTISFKYADYPNITNLLFSNYFLPVTWTYNSLTSFQCHNFCNKEDIDFLKLLIKQILKSKFWQEIEETYIEHDFFEEKIFADEGRIEEFLNNIIFVPFDAKNLGLSGYTFAEDLIIFISGYPFTNYSSNLIYYKINRILNLALLTIIILHECLHYCKRMLYFITCGMISRETFINEKRQEAGLLFERLIFGWEEPNNKEYYDNNQLLKSEKFNIKIALKLLNPNTYNQSINKVKDILYNYQEEEIYGDILKEYLIKLDLNEEETLSQFIEDFENVTVNAKRDYDNELYAEYFRSDHRKVGQNNKFIK